MSREAILARIRAANPDPPPHQPALTVPPPSLTTRGADAIARFRHTAIAKGMTIVDVPSLDALPSAIAQALSAAGIADRSLRLKDPLLTGLPWTSAGLSAQQGPAAPTDTMGLSRALAAVAETGTLMLASGAANPTTLAFLPETHLVALDATSILGTFEDATALLRQTYGGALPRSVNFISGASRTGDIGGRIVHGAHGPRRVIIFLF